MALGSIADVSQNSTSSLEESDVSLPSSSLDFTQAVYAAQGAELDLLGVNLAFAPVGDVNSDPENPVIGVRSFGDGTCRSFSP